MKQELCAYLIRDDGRVSDMPTDELLGALDQVKRGSAVQGHIKGRVPGVLKRNGKPQKKRIAPAST